jgi:hypothetical protein
VAKVLKLSPNTITRYLKVLSETMPPIMPSALERKSLDRKDFAALYAFVQCLNQIRGMRQIAKNVSPQDLAKIIAGSANRNQFERLIVDSYQRALKNTSPAEALFKKAQILSD